MTILRLATRRAAAVLAASVLTMLTLGGCSSDDEPADTAATETGSASPSISVIPPASVEPTETVNANTASVDELTAAFEAAGIADAEKWAQEVEAYRPYTGDDNWAQLKGGLAKLNIDPVTFAKIVSVLEA